MTAAEQVVPGLIGFKGALGRIDRLHLLPGDNVSFRVQPDGICVNGTDGAGPVVRAVDTEVNMEDFAVSLLVKPAAGDPFARVLGTKETCKPFEADKAGTSDAPSIVVRCNPVTAEVERKEGRLNIRVPLPGGATLLQAPATPEEPSSGAVTVIITRKPEDAAKHGALLRQIDAEGCAAHCGELLQSGALACVDKIYRLTSAGHYESDPIPCMVGTATVAKNDFRKQCENAEVDSDLASCTDTPTHLTFWQDSCGGVHIPFDWSAIRRDAQGKPIPRRVVGGSSGTSLARKGQDSRIWVPGREFLGSTPYADPQGTGSTTDWRFPEIDVWYPNEPSEEMGLRGSTDQDDSIVHAFPRMPVSIVCDGVAGDEACMAVEGRQHGRGLDCACTDRYPSGCTCKLISPRYFACGGGDYKGMPCTRHAHCNSRPGGSPSGKCSGQPTCQPRTEKGVWKPGRGHTSGKKCWTDAECVSQGADHRCGYRLFDFNDRQTNGVIVLDAEIKDLPNARVDRGACKQNRKKFCSNLQTNKRPCATPDGTCRGYVLRAEGE